MKKVVCMMVIWSLCVGATATMAQQGTKQDTTRRDSRVKGQPPRTDTSRTPRKTTGTTKRDTTRRK